jgi:hypothetical protein
MPRGIFGGTGAGCPSSTLSTHHRITNSARFS